MGRYNSLTFSGSLTASTIFKKQFPVTLLQTAQPDFHLTGRLYQKVDPTTFMCIGQLPSLSDECSLFSAILTMWTKHIAIPIKCFVSHLRCLVMTGQLVGLKEKRSQSVR